MSIMEKQFIIHSDHSTMYRIRANPDAESRNGSDGIVLEWRDPGDIEWSNYFFIPPECITNFIAAMKEFDVNGNKRN